MDTIDDTLQLELQLENQLRDIERTITVQGNDLVLHLLALLHMSLAVFRQSLHAALLPQCIQIGWSLILEIHALLHTVVVVVITLQNDDPHLRACEIPRRRVELELRLCRDRHLVSRPHTVIVLLHRASVIEIMFTILPHQTPGPIHKWVGIHLQVTATAIHALISMVLHPGTMTILLDHASLASLESQLRLVHLQLQSPCQLTTAPKQTLCSPPLLVPGVAPLSDETLHVMHPTAAHPLTAAAATTTPLPRATHPPHQVTSLLAPEAAVASPTPPPTVPGPVHRSVPITLPRLHTPAPSASTPILPPCRPSSTEGRNCRVDWTRHRRSGCSSWKMISAS